MNLVTLVEQIRTGLVLPEELTEPEVVEVLAFLEREPNRAPVEIAERLGRLRKLAASRLDRV